jgi:rhodanese-related sulfurtransferase
MDVDTFVTQLLAGLEDIPAYYARVGPTNAAGPRPLDLTAPARTDGAQLAARLAAGEWVVDLRGRVAFAAGHLAGSFNFEADGKLATYLAWLIPVGKPVTLLADTPGQLAAAQRELARVGIDRPAGAATGDPTGWLPAGWSLRSYRRATFTELATARQHGEAPVVLDVRRDSERAEGYLLDSVHIPIHQIRERAAEVPPGTIWVYCASGIRATIAASMLAAVGRHVVLIDNDFADARAAGVATVDPAADNAT